MVRDEVHLVLITRLNVFMYGGPPPSDRTVLARRLELFERWTVPSVGRQACPPDEWLVLADRGTHPDDLARLRTALAGLPARVVLLPSSFTPEEYREIMGRELDTDRPWLMTVRLDSDDAIASHYLQGLVSAAIPGAPEFLNVESGYRLAGRRLCLDVEPSNAFMGLLEPGGSPAPLTAYCSSHMRAAEVAPVRQVPLPPAWLVIIHDHNMSSGSRGGRASLGALRVPFGVSRSQVLLRHAARRLRRVGRAFGQRRPRQRVSGT